MLAATVHQSCRLPRLEVTAAALRLRKGTRFTYEYDLNIPWRHEIRIENWLAPEIAFFEDDVDGLMDWR